MAIKPKEDQSKGNKSAPNGETTDSHLIGPRQEYRRTGVPPDASDAGGGKTTPYSW